VAVIPDNRDNTLRFGPECNDFWSRVRAWQSKGWTIAMHGYQHVFCTADPGIMGLNCYSEFAGLSYDEQSAKITAACQIMTAQGVRPDAWVAPAHSFDDTTVRVLASEFGSSLLISDGFFPYPGRDRYGLLWLPQQIWQFRPMPLGVWTVCAHPSQWLAEDLANFEAAIRLHPEVITNVEEVTRLYGRRNRSSLDKAFSRMWRWLVQYKTGCRNRTVPILTEVQCQTASD
jgi:hypothetical protein